MNFVADRSNIAGYVTNVASDITITDGDVKNKNDMKAKLNDIKNEVDRYISVSITNIKKGYDISVEELSKPRFSRFTSAEKQGLLQLYQIAEDDVKGMCLEANNLYDESIRRIDSCNCSIMPDYFTFQDITKRFTSLVEGVTNRVKRLDDDAVTYMEKTIKEVNRRSHKTVTVNDVCAKMDKLEGILDGMGMKLNMMGKALDKIAADQQRIAADQQQLFDDFAQIRAKNEEWHRRRQQEHEERCRRRAAIRAYRLANPHADPLAEFRRRRQKVTQNDVLKPIS